MTRGDSIGGAGLLARHDRQLRYLIAGGVNTAFGLSVYPLLLLTFATLQRRYLLGLAIAQVFSVLFAFASYKLGVFRTRGRTAGEFGRFAAFNGVAIAANWIVLPLMVELAHVQPIAVQIGFAAVLIVSGWFWHSRITFRDDR